MNMQPFEELIKQSKTIEEKLGYHFKDPSLLALAFVHCSYVNEDRRLHVHNERLEFLGDSVLGLIVAEYLYSHFPATAEGNLSLMRARIVEASSCAQFAQALNLQHHLLLGKGERMNDGRGKESIAADFFEALMGAIYLDGGLEAAKHFLFSHFSEDIKRLVQEPASNWKSLLQDYCQKLCQMTPTYTIVEQEGPEHNKSFTVAALLGDKKLGIGRGASKKEAQQAAAKAALESLEGTTTVESKSEV